MTNDAPWSANQRSAASVTMPSEQRGSDLDRRALPVFPMALLLACLLACLLRSRSFSSHVLRTVCSPIGCPRSVIRFATSLYAFVKGIPFSCSARIIDLCNTGSTKLFESSKYDLSTDAQLKLAKLSGIIQAHPGLHLAIEGYTDTTGTADFNLKLSQQRADAVRQFLISQGLLANAITSKGLGEADPVADNNTAVGRQQNRRVEIVVSGEVIGVKLA